jgi:hypothetical protein
LLLVINLPLVWVFREATAANAGFVMDGRNRI